MPGINFIYNNATAKAQYELKNKGRHNLPIRHNTHTRNFVLKTLSRSLLESKCVEAISKTIHAWTSQRVFVPAQVHHLPKA